MGMGKSFQAAGVDWAWNVLIGVTELHKVFSQKNKNGIYQLIIFVWIYEENNFKSKLISFWIQIMITTWKSYKNSLHMMIKLY